MSKSKQTTQPSHTPITCLAMTCVREKLSLCKKSHVPNKKTSQTLKSAENGEDLTTFDSVDDFLKFLRNEC